MDDNVPHSPEFGPRDVRVTFHNVSGYHSDSIANDTNVTDHGVRCFVVFTERIEPDANGAEMMSDDYRLDATMLEADRA